MREAATFGWRLGIKSKQKGHKWQTARARARKHDQVATSVWNLSWLDERNEAPLAPGHGFSVLQTLEPASMRSEQASLQLALTT
jgi:hypothetical protein